MKRFINSAFFNSARVNVPRSSILIHKPTHRHSSLLNHPIYSFSHQTMKSRQVDLKISQQRWKNLQSNYKALKTSFGLHVPKTISKNHPTPDRILFNLQTLRQCSNQYPQYLFQQLKKPDSKFLQVIDDSLNKLWSAEKKEAVEFVLFLMHWNIHQRGEEIGEMMLRAIKKLDLSLFDIFELCKVVLKGVVDETRKEVNELLKTNPEMKQKLSVVNIMDPIMKKLLTICETRIIQRLQVMQAQQYEPLFKIINLFRFYDVYPQVKAQKKSVKASQNKEPPATNQKEQQQQEQATFFDIIQTRLLKNIDQIPPSSLVIMAVHYANNTKQDQDQRINILQKMQQRIIFTMKFFNHDQLIAILYSYIKTSLLSQEFTKQLVQRIRLIYSEMSWQDKKKILALSSNFPQHEKNLIISEAHHQIFKGKPIITKLQDGSIKKQFDPNVFIELDYQLVPQIYLASYQNNLLTQQLCKKMQQIILLNIYNYDRQQVVRSVWLFTVSPSIVNNLQRLHKKLEVIIEGGFQAGQYTVKDLSIIVWSLCNSGVNNQQIYKPEAKFWDNIQFYLQEKLSKQQPNSQPTRLSNISSVLWAYTFNRPLKFKTVSLITDIIFQDMNYPSKHHTQPNLQSFELINIITYYYSLPSKAFPQSLITKIKELCVTYFQAMYQQMGSLELMKCLKYLAADEYDQGKTKLVIKIRIWEDIIKTFLSEVNEIDYEQIMGIVGSVINSPLGRAKDKRVMELVSKLLKRKKSLEQVRKIEEMSEQSKR